MEVMRFFGKLKNGNVIYGRAKRIEWFEEFSPYPEDKYSPIRSTGRTFKSYEEMKKYREDNQ